MRRLYSLFLISAIVFIVFIAPALQAQSNSVPYSPTGLLVWTDKYVYTPGET